MLKKLFILILFFYAFINCEEKNSVEVFKFSVDGNQEIKFKAKNFGKPVITWEDISKKGIPIEDIKIENLNIGKRLPSGSKLKLYPDRLGIWEYDFGMRRLPDEYFKLSDEEKKEYLNSIYPYNKRLNDPVEPFNHVEVKANDLKISFYYKRIKKITYFVDFGSDFEVIGLLVWPWDVHPDGTGDGGGGFWAKENENGEYLLDIIVSKDEKCEEIINKKTLNIEEVKLIGLKKGGPVYLPINGLSSFYITIQQTKGEGTHLAGGHFKCFLRYKGKEWINIKEGENKFNYSEKTNGERKIEFLINKEIIFPDFYGSLDKLNIKGKNCIIEKISPEKCPDSYVNATGILRIKPDENFLKEEKTKRSFYFSIELPEGFRNLKDVKSIYITYRVPTSTGRLQIGAYGIYGDNPNPRFIPTGAPPIIPDTKSSISYWIQNEKMIPEPENMGNVFSFTINSWGPTWALSENDNFCIEIGSIEFIKFEEGEKEIIEKIKKEKEEWEKMSKESQILQRLKEKPLPKGKIINPKEIFARGIYSVPIDAKENKKFGCKDKWEFREKILNDLKEHNLNAFHFSCYGEHNEDLENFVKLASEKGFYLWAAGPILLSKEHKILQIQWQLLKEEFKKRLIKWKDVPTFLAWAITEEPDKWEIKYLKEAREIMKEIGSQSQIIIYNKKDILLEDVENEPYPVGVSMDCYPILVWGNRFDRYIDFLKTTYEGTKKIKGVSWIVFQLTEGGIWRSPTESEVKFQVWSAIAYNVKGFFPFLYDSCKNDDFSDKPFYKYYGNEMKKVGVLEKLLILIERDDNLNLLEIPDWAISGFFKDRNNPDLNFAIIVNTDVKNKKELNLKVEKKEDIVCEIYVKEDKIFTEEVKEKIIFNGGEGRIFFIGKKVDFEKFKRIYLR